MYRNILFLILLFMSFFPAAQIAPGNLTGYWLEKESPDKVSLSTLLVFNLDDTGNMKGVIYFMDSDDSNQEFKLSDIRIEGNGISFIIGKTTISFFGEMGPDTAAFSGVFYLDDGVKVEVEHQKLDDKTINKLEVSRRLIPKQQIDHTAGLLIG